jgi:peptidoglycan/LPS O-acetylase OafA/YrhL
VLLVVAFHAKVPGFSGGFVGVDVFFVLSGYLITALLVKEVERTGSIDLVQFYARRARRLLPASAIVLVTTLLVSRYVLAPVEMETVSRTARATAVYLSNVWFLRNAADYFGSAAETNPFLHTWSLAVEEQFYFVWPVLILLAMKAQPTRHRLVRILSSVTALSIAGSVWLTYTNQPWAFFMSPARAWEFGIGGLASVASLPFSTTRPRLIHAGGLVGVALILLSALLLNSSILFPGFAALVPVTGTVLALVGGSGSQDRILGRLLGSGILQVLGRLSYSWYLWHWPFLVWAAVISPDLSVFGRAVVAVGSLLAAAVAYRLVENPIRFQGWLVARPRFSVLVAVIMTLTSFGVAKQIGALSQSDAKSPRQRAYTEAARDYVWVLREGGACNLTGFFSVPRECVFGDSTASRTLVLTGDSHAAHWLPALEKIARANGFRIVLLQQNSCPTPRLAVYQASLQREFTECTEFREAVIARILELHPSAVILGNATHSYVIGRHANGAAQRFTPEEWTAGQRRTLQTLDSAKIRTVLLHDTPRSSFNVPVCLARATALGRDPEAQCAIDRRHALDLAVYTAEANAVKGLPVSTVLNLNSLLCDRSRCAPVIDGLVVYRDETHLTRTFSLHLADRLAARLLPLIP